MQVVTVTPMSSTVRPDSPKSGIQKEYLRNRRSRRVPISHALNVFFELFEHKHRATVNFIKNSTPFLLSFVIRFHYTIDERKMHHKFLFFLKFIKNMKKGLDFFGSFVYNKQVNRHGCLAQLVELSLDVRRVSGSSPLASTKKKSRTQVWLFFLVLFTFYFSFFSFLFIRDFSREKRREKREKNRWLCSAKRL